MIRLYYGNGSCTIEGTGIRGVQIKYAGAIKIDKTANDNFHIIKNDKMIMVFPVGAGHLNDLFNYIGNFRIKSAIAANDEGKLPVIVKRVMDYSELLNTKAEDMTTKSEDLKEGYGRDIITKTRSIQPLIKNLHTGGWDIVLYLEDNTEYNGDFHIHIETSAAMTGSEHSRDSQDLYIKRVIRGELIDKLVPTKRAKGTRDVQRRVGARSYGGRSGGRSGGGSGSGY